MTQSRPTSPNHSAFLREVRRRWLPDPADRPRALVHRLCNLLDDPEQGPAQRLAARELLREVEVELADPLLEEFGADLGELRRLVRARFESGLVPREGVLCATVDVEVLRAFTEAAAAHGVARDELTARLFCSVSRGLTDPNSWVHDYVAVLLQEPGDDEPEPSG